MRRHARGATLVSLMVGLTLSMLVVSAMMLVLRNVAHTTGEARRDAQVDDNLVAGLLSAGLTLHEAGFNIADARLGNALIVVSSAELKGQKLIGTLDTGYTGNLLVWKQNLAGTEQCSGLLAQTDGSLLQLIAQDCAAIGEWESLNWSTRVIVRATDPEQKTSPFALAINVTEGLCAPFGISARANHPQVTLSAPNSNMNQLKTVECLGNFVAPVSTPAPASS